MRLHYHAMAYYLDENVGKLVEKFKEKGMWDNTLMLFTSDNGGPIYGLFVLQSAPSQQTHFAAPVSKGSPRRAHWDPECPVIGS